MVAGGTLPVMNLAVRGLTFDVRLDGPEEGRPVLLLHGFPQHSGEWGLVLPALHAAGLRTIAPDQRGYSPGARPARISAYTQGEAVQDALALLDALDIDSAYVVGHDWGALVGWQLASRYPDRVRTLTAVSIPHPIAMADAIATDPDQQQRSAYIQLFRQSRAEQLLLDDGARRLRAMFAGCPPELVDSYVTPMLEPAALTGGLNWYRALSRADNDGLGPTPVPTTFVWGDQDPASGPVGASRCGNYVTGDYTFVVLPGVGHWIPDEAPDQLAAAILDRIGA